MENKSSTNHNEEVKKEDLILSNDETEKCILPQFPPAIPATPVTQQLFKDSNIMSNQETELQAAMMSEEVVSNKLDAATLATTSSSSYSSAAMAVDITTTDSINGGSTTTTNTITTTTTSTATATNTSESGGIVPVTATACNSSPLSCSSGSPNQFVTPLRVSEYKSMVLHLESGTAQPHHKKKKRNKSSKCLGGIGSGGDGSGGGGGGGSMHDHDSSSSLLSNIKTSLSMTSLPPDEKQESRDGINAKLKVERPYNSLKKNADRNLTNQLAHMHRASKNHSSGGGGGNSGSSSNTQSNNKYNRYSWGSGHSSSSLHSSAATLGIGSGKDDLWAAIQTNYNYIMDTNLLDTCKEARCEIEGAVSVMDNTADTCFKMLDDNSRNVGSCEDPKELRKWLRNMEHKMENAPTLSEATMLSCAELESHLTEHSVLYHEIVSHARIVSACIRAASEKEQQQKLQQQQQQQQQQQLLQQQQQHQQQHDSDASLIAEQNNSSLSSTDDTATTSSGIVCSSLETKLPLSPTGSHTANSSTGGSIAAAPITHSKKSESNWDRLQNRYHLLYLKAFEVQLWLDGLLRKKSSSVGNLTNEDLDSEDIDDLIDSSDDCLDNSNGNAVQQNVDDDGAATEDDLNDVASDLESDITHNSLSYNEDGDEDNDNNSNSNNNSNIQQKQHKQQQQHHHRCLSDNDNEENNVSSHRQQHQLHHQHHHHHSHTNSHHHHHHHQTSVARDCIQNKIDCEHEGDDEEDYDDDDEDCNDNDIDEDEIDSPKHQRKSLGYTKLLVSFDRSSGRSSSAATHYKAQLTLTDFEADSESSDFETIQKRIRNQRSSGGKAAIIAAIATTPPTTSAASASAATTTGPTTFGKYPQANANNGNLPHNIANKRYCNPSNIWFGDCHGETATLEITATSVPSNTTELESCETHDMQTKTAVVASETVVNAMVNDHLHQQLKMLQQQQLHQQQQQHHQRLTLMAITKNTMMTTGSSAATTGATSSSNSSSLNASNSSSNSNITASSLSSNGNIMLPHKLTGNENNQQHHHGNIGANANSAGGPGSNAAAAATAATVVALAKKQKNIAIISPNNSHNGNKSHHHHHPHHQPHHHSNNKSPTVLRKHLEHHHSADISKFNRSNRKSKNCAIFYFKHLDTDNETNYSNSICGDDVVHDATSNVVGSGGDGGSDVGDIGAGGNARGTLSSSTDSSHASDLLKSADVSSDDEGWLYTSVSPQQQQPALGGIESLNSNHISSCGISASSEFHSSATIQSGTVSSSTSEAAKVVAIQGDDSDKENKEAKSTTSTAKIHLTTNTSACSSPGFAATTTVVDRVEQSNLANSKPEEGTTYSSCLISSTSSASSSSTSFSCSSSSNDMLTEATTTTAASIKTNATQIRQKQHSPQMQRSEMELQNNKNNNNNNNNGNNNSMQHNAMNNFNNNNNCVNSSSSLSPITATATNSLDKIIGSNHNNRGNRSGGGKNNNNVTATNKSSPQRQQPQHQKHQHARNSSYSDDAANGNLEKENLRFYTRADICNINVIANDNHQQPHHHQHAGLANAVPPTASSHPLYAQQLHANVGKRLPPRSPAKTSNSPTSTSTSTSTISPTKGKVSHESIKQLVLEAEHLVRDEALKTPTKQQQHHQFQYHQKHSTINGCGGSSGGSGGGIVQITSTIKKREVKMPGPIKRVQEWLEHQPSTPVQLKSSHVGPHDQLVISPSSAALSPARNDDCEASGEASETDSIPQHCSDDTSEGFTDSIATCMQTSTNSYGNSTERIGGSAEPIVVATSNQSLNVKVVKRHQQIRRKSERPWSVSCLSQLTTDAKQVAAKVCTITNVQSGLATHSISESALDSLSPGRPRTSSTAAQVKGYDSKGSLKKRKIRKKKHFISNGKKSDTNSEDNHESKQHPQGLILQTCESMTPQQIQEITQALLQLQSSGSTVEQLSPTTQVNNSAIALGSNVITNSNAITITTTNESGEEENHLMKPNFRVGSITTAYMTNEARLGSLAALATYMNEEEQHGGEYTTGTEDHHSSFSETAWDNYQEKYNSENYSEGFDSDAARKLLEFGDDYRNFIDSQSDCCSSLSAANNLDSFSPPRMDSLQQNESKIIITQDTIVSSVDHARRRRALELEYERRRKNLEIRRKSCQESLEYHNPKTPTAATLSSSTQALTPKNPERFHFQQQQKLDSASRKLEFGMSHSAQSLRRTSESDTSQRRRKADERRRSSRNLEKCIKLIPATSSSSGDDSDDEKEIRNLLQQSHNRLEDTKALKIRCHLLRPEDYTEIINTCRDNIRCLESVLKGPSSSVLSSQSVTQSKDLLAAWEDLLGWSENAATARKMQEDMIVLKHALSRLGNKSSFELLDTEPSIQIAIEALKNEKSTLQTYRTNMLKLNASVHSWLTRQERRLQNALVEQQLKEAASKVGIVLLEEKDELESEHNLTNNNNSAATITSSSQLQEQNAEPTNNTTISSKTTMITVTDSNGNQVESHSATSTSTSTTTSTSIATTASITSTSNAGTSTYVQTTSTVGSSSSEKNWDLQSLITSENEFHKHLKDEVSDMYTAWDEADSRINTQLEVLTSSLIAWRQLECGLSEFHLALGQDRGTLKGLEGALNTGHATPGELAQNVKLVAKLLSEKVHVSQEQLTAVQDYLDPNHILHIAKFTASNGSLSDSGISDGGATSDGGLSERERRLGVLRRLAKQLESALAPGSEAMKSIAARMESAEVELKSLQNTCRDLIVRTAASHQSKKQQLQDQSSSAMEKKHEAEVNPMQMQHTNGFLCNGKAQHLAGAQGQQVASNCYTSSGGGGGRRSKRKPRRNSGNGLYASDAMENNGLQLTAPDGGDDPSDDPSMAYDLDSSDDELTPKSKRGWAWRIARVAVPMQLALFTVFCAACLMQPNCCDNINNLSMSFTPQLRYIRGPPPI